MLYIFVLIIILAILGAKWVSAPEKKPVRPAETPAPSEKTAPPEEVTKMSLNTITLISEAFDRHNIKYRAIENETLSLIEAGFNIQGGPAVRFHFFSQDDDRNDVPYTRFEQSIYVMRMVRSEKGSRAEELKCFADVKRIRALLLKKQYEGDEELKGWNRTARRDFVSGAANYVGWKLKLPFVEEESWEL